MDVNYPTISTKGCRACKKISNNYENFAKVAKFFATHKSLKDGQYNNMLVERLKHSNVILDIIDFPKTRRLTSIILWLCGTASMIVNLKHDQTRSVNCLRSKIQR